MIAGTREADLAFTAVARTFPELAGTPYVVVDVGGGSTEFIVTDGTRVVSAVSVPIGAVRLTERHLQHDPPSSDEVKSLIANIDGELDKLALPTGVPIIATAGTATTMAAIQLGLETYDPAAVTGFRMEQGAIDALFGVLALLAVNARKLIPGLEHQRADVIAGGVAIYSRAMGRMNAPILITCDRGIRWGVAYEQLAKN